MDEPMCYVGRASCGCLKMAVVDCKETARDMPKIIFEAVRQGLTIERVTCDYVRENMRRCPHGRQPAAQTSLPGTEQAGG